MTTEIAILTTALLDMPQVACPVNHHFAPGVYLRQIFMPAGTFVVGHRHKTEHFNIILQGRVRLLVDGKVVEYAAPYTFVSQAGVQKVLYVLEDTIWQTIHQTEETDIATLEAEIVEPSQEKITHEQQKELTQ